MRKIENIESSVFPVKKPSLHESVRPTLPDYAVGRIATLHTTKKRLETCLPTVVVSCVTDAEGNHFAAYTDPDTDKRIEVQLDDPLES